MIMKKNLFVFLLCILIHQVSFAQTAKYEQISKVATTKQFKVFNQAGNWHILDYNGEDIIAYCYVNSKQLRLIRFDTNFRIKASTKAKIENHVLSIWYTNDVIHLVTRQGSLYHYAFSAKDFTLQNKTELLQTKGLKGVKTDVLWSPSSKYIGIFLLANKPATLQVYLYDQDFNRINFKEMPKEKEIYYYSICDNGEWLWRSLADGQTMHSLTREGYKQYHMKQKNLACASILENNDDEIILMASNVFSFNKKTNEEKIVSSFPDNIFVNNIYWHKSQNSRILPFYKLYTLPIELKKNYLASPAVAEAVWNHALDGKKYTGKSLPDEIIRRPFFRDAPNRKRYKYVTTFLDGHEGEIWLEDAGMVSMDDKYSNPIFIDNILFPLFDTFSFFSKDEKKLYTINYSYKEGVDEVSWNARFVEKDKRTQDLGRGSIGLAYLKQVNSFFYKDKLLLWLHGVDQQEIGIVKIE